MAAILAVRFEQVGIEDAERQQAHIEMMTDVEGGAGFFDQIQALLEERPHLVAGIDGEERPALRQVNH